MLGSELAFEDRPDFALLQLLQIMIEEGTNFAAGLNEFDPDIGDLDGVDLKHNSITASMAGVEQFGPIVGAIREVYAGERNLDTGLANLAGQHGVGAEGEEYSLGFGEGAVAFDEFIAESYLFGDWEI